VRVLVLGSGAIGSLYGAKLAAHADVTLVARADHVAAVNRDGLRVVGLDDLHCRPRAVTSVDAIEPETLVLLTTKVTDSAAAVGPLVPLLRPDTVILCVQNGLDSEREAARVVGGRCTVLRAITHFGAIFREPGVVDQRIAGATLLEPAPPSARVAALLTSAGLEGRVSDRIRYEMWRKLIFNCVVNPVTAMTGMDVGWIADERLNRLKQAIIDECVAVAQLDGVPIEEDVLALVNLAYAGSKNLSSTLQDLVKGRRTEIDFLNGGVARLGRELGIECPVNAALATLVHQLEGRA
jgi:2-dehydropantoate 2-reductase